MQTRRNILLTGAATFAAAGGGLLAWRAPGEAATANFEITKTPAEWKAQLTDAEYRVLREEGTERPFSSPLNEEKRAGIFSCAGCDLDVYSSEAKFKSGTGWPSFTSAIDGAVGTKADHKLFRTRTEVHCRRCGGHLGHIFDDGPAPTGKRHCLNGVALNFTAA